MIRLVKVVALLRLHCWVSRYFMIQNVLKVCIIVNKRLSKVLHQCTL